MARTVLQVTKRQEVICIEDADGETLYEWTVATDDASLQKMLNCVSNAFIRAQDLDKAAEEAKTPEAVREANEATAKLQRRVISAIIGEAGYNDILAYIGDGEPVDPCEHIIAIGDVFGALCTWLYRRCTAKQLRDAGLYLESEGKRTGGRWAPGKGKPRKGKKGRK